MKARRAGVSTIWAMFSRVTSKTSGSSCSSRNPLDLLHEGELLGRELEVHAAAALRSSVLASVRPLSGPPTGVIPDWSSDRIGYHRHRAVCAGVGWGGTRDRERRRPFAQRGGRGGPPGTGAPDRQLGRTLALTHNLGGYPGEMVSFVSVVGTERD